MPKINERLQTFENIGTTAEKITESEKEQTKAIILDLKDVLTHVEDYDKEPQIRAFIAMKLQDVKDKEFFIKQEEEKKDLKFDEYEKQINEYFEKATEANQADLARYVCHRKAIIEFFKQQLKLNKEGKYNPEKNIHNLIFPMGKSSDDILFKEHNLWLVDEKLAFHIFLSSDIPLNKTKMVKSDSKLKPDILVFNKATAFSDSITPFTSITIIEIKKPLRIEYSKDENPFEQVMNYIDEIKAGKAKIADGRPFTIQANMPFYCFIICDITPQLKTWAQKAELDATPDNLGYYGYKKHYSAYIEVISYDKLVNDAEKRNKAFFDKLGV